jgi:hypothetical protein
MEDIGIFYGYSVYLWPFGEFHGHLVYFKGYLVFFPVLVCCTKKNLATLF